ncbi:transposase [Streptomyces sp. NPDC093249]|uniref:transposase n=1 Tax=unclassified Streptomyces TaxID=2593676 RepID=UPI00380F6AFC
MPSGIPARDLVRLAKARWRIEHDYRELKTALGLDHFEGRSFADWHRHAPSSPPPTCSRLNSGDTQKPLPGPDPPPGPGPPPTAHRHLDRHLPHLPTDRPMAALRRYRAASFSSSRNDSATDQVRSAASSSQSGSSGSV